MDAIVLNGVRKRFRRYPSRGRRTLWQVLRAMRPLTGERNRHRYIDVLKGITCSVPDGTTLGVIGRNGSGKSTLLRVIAGIYRPEDGVAAVNGRVAALLGLGVGFHPDLSGRDNLRINALALGLTRTELRARFDDIVRFAELEEFIDAPMRTYSSGMHMRLAFSVAINVDPDILLLDEVLAVGDARFARKCHDQMDRLKHRNKTIVLLSHDLNAIEHWCDRAMWLDDGVIRADGRPQDIVALYRNATAERIGEDR